jgi:hypothetical protein
MYISNMTHFLDKEGNIAKEMHKEGREHASFLSLIIDAVTKDYKTPIQATGIRCLQNGCKGTIDIVIDTKNETIDWMCTDCDEAGKISGWQSTKWDNRK